MSIRRYGEIGIEPPAARKDRKLRIGCYKGMSQIDLGVWYWRLYRRYLARHYPGCLPALNHFWAPLGWGLENQPRGPQESNLSSPLHASSLECIISAPSNGVWLSLDAALSTHDAQEAERMDLMASNWQWRPSKKTIDSRRNFQLTRQKAQKACNPNAPTSS